MAPRDRQRPRAWSNSEGILKLTRERTALAHDFLAVPGGAEQVLLHLLRSRADFDLVVAWIDERAFERNQIPIDRCRELTRATGLQGWHALKALRAFERPAPFWNHYQTILFSGVFAPVAALQRPAGRNLYYCHTPPRFAYDLEAWYRRSVPPPLRPALGTLASRVRRSFAAGMQRMDRIAANSENVRRRLEQYLRLEEVRVIHPPVETGNFRWIEQGDFYLSTARLEPYKRVQLLVQAFLRMPERKLVVASGGSQLAALRRLAAGADNIRFTDWLGRDRLRDLMGRCIATLYLPMDEDFGMSPVESMAAGKPVVGVAEGGLLETVVHGATGWLIDGARLAGAAEASTEAIVEAVARMNPTRAAAMRSACEERAAAFDRSVFDRHLESFLAP